LYGVVCRLISHSLGSTTLLIRRGAEVFKASRSARICTVLVLAAIVSCESRHEPPAEPSSIDLYPAISPDGEWVVYTRYGPALQPGFYRTRIGSAGAELLIADWVEADWNPDGRTLVLAMGQQIYRYDLATAELAPLTTVGLNLAPAWSPDGRTIAFATNAGDGTHPPDLWLMQGDASAPRRVPLPGPPRDELSHVDWAPSGDRLVGPSFRGLFITDTLGRDTLYLRTASTFQADPAWSPTGEWIAYSTADQTYGDIWLVRPDGTQNHRLIPRAGQPAWFPDGQRLAVVRPGPEAQTIWAVDLDGQLLQELTSSAE
jgi:dipeptidyl aminopeptidase/acylaminoacyl peptidase